MALYNAAGYAKYNHYQRCESFKVLVKCYDIISAIPYPAKVLDVGCGTGDVTKLLTYIPNINNVVAFDKSKEMVVFADTFSSDSRIQYTMADVEVASTWPMINQNVFDLVVSFFVLHWITDTEVALKNIFQCLKPNGLFIAKLLGRWSQAEVDMMDFIRTHKKWSKYYPQHFMKPQPWMEVEDPAYCYSSYLKSAGFEDVLCTNVVAKRIVPSKTYMKEYLKVSRLLTCSMPESEFDQFVEECTEAWLKSAKHLNNGSMELSVPMIDVTARKT